MLTSDCVSKALAVYSAFVGKQEIDNATPGASVLFLPFFLLSLPWSGRLCECEQCYLQYGCSQDRCMRVCIVCSTNLHPLHALVSGPFVLHALMECICIENVQQTWTKSSPLGLIDIDKISQHQGSMNNRNKYTRGDQLPFIAEHALSPCFFFKPKRASLYFIENVTFTKEG